MKGAFRVQMEGIIKYKCGTKNVTRGSQVVLLLFLFSYLRISGNQDALYLEANFSNSSASNTCLTNDLPNCLSPGLRTRHFSRRQSSERTIGRQPLLSASITGLTNDLSNRLSPGIRNGYFSRRHPSERTVSRLLLLKPGVAPAI